MFLSAAFAITYQDSGQTRSSTTYISHSTIYIVGDSQLAAFAISESWPGNGGASSPYIISTYDIDGAGHQYGIDIQDTTLSFVIQDCYIHGATNAGIRLTNVIHATLLRDVCSSSQYGIDLESSTGNSIIGCDCSGLSNSGILISSSGYTHVENNTCSSDGSSGIYCQSSENLTIANNTCNSDTSYGIYLYAASNSMISGNVCSNDFNGIYVLSTARSTLIGNTCTGGGLNGIYMRLSDTNTITDNNCSSSSTGLYIRSCIGNNVERCWFWSNTGYGVWLDTGAMFNRITNNTFAYNNGASGVFDPTYIQAYDAVGTSSWNSVGTPHGFGNYWYDWTSPDVNGDGIVDAPYVLTAGAKDNYPLVSPPATQIPEFGPLGLLMVLIASIAVVLSLSRRMKT